MSDTTVLPPLPNSPSPITNVPMEPVSPPVTLPPEQVLPPAPVEVFGEDKTQQPTTNAHPQSSSPPSPSALDQALADLEKEAMKLAEEKQPADKEVPPAKETVEEKNTPMPASATTSEPPKEKPLTITDLEKPAKTVDEPTVITPTADTPPPVSPEPPVSPLPVIPAAPPPVSLAPSAATAPKETVKPAISVIRGSGMETLKEHTASTTSMFDAPVKETLEEKPSVTPPPPAKDDGKKDKAEEKVEDGDVTGSRKKKKGLWKKVAAVGALTVLVIGLGVGIFVARQSQDVRQQASSSCSRFDKGACTPSGCKWEGEQICGFINNTCPSGCTFTPAKAAQLAQGKCEPRSSGDSSTSCSSKSQSTCPSDPKCKWTTTVAAKPAVSATCTGSYGGSCTGTYGGGTTSTITQTCSAWQVACPNGSVFTETSCEVQALFNNTYGSGNGQSVWKDQAKAQCSSPPPPANESRCTTNSGSPGQTCADLNMCDIVGGCNDACGSDPRGDRICDVPNGYCKSGFSCRPASDTVIVKKCDNNQCVNSWCNRADVGTDRCKTCSSNAECTGTSTGPSDRHDNNCPNNTCAVTGGQCLVVNHCNTVGSNGICVEPGTPYVKNTSVNCQDEAKKTCQYIQIDILPESVCNGTQTYEQAGGHQGTAFCGPPANCVPQAASCNNTCTTNGATSGNFVCTNGQWRNPSCTDKTDCNCGGGNPPGESPPPTNPPGAPMCQGISKDVSTPKAGDQVAFTCTESSGANRYEFRYKIGTAAWQSLDPLNATARTSKPVTAQDGTYSVQCRPCTDTCASWSIAN